MARITHSSSAIASTSGTVGAVLQHPIPAPWVADRLLLRGAKNSSTEAQLRERVRAWRGHFLSPVILTDTDINKMPLKELYRKQLLSFYAGSAQEDRNIYFPKPQQAFLDEKATQYAEEGIGRAPKIDYSNALGWGAVERAFAYSRANANYTEGRSKLSHMLRSFGRHISEPFYNFFDPFSRGSQLQLYVMFAANTGAIVETVKTAEIQHRTAQAIEADPINRLLFRLTSLIPQSGVVVPFVVEHTALLLAIFAGARYSIVRALQDYRVDDIKLISKIITIMTAALVGDFTWDASFVTGVNPLSHLQPNPVVAAIVFTVFTAGVATAATVNLFNETRRDRQSAGECRDSFTSPMRLTDTEISKMPIVELKRKMLLSYYMGATEELKDRVFSKFQRAFLGGMAAQHVESVAGTAKPVDYSSKAWLPVEAEFWRGRKPWTMGPLS